MPAIIKQNRGGALRTQVGQIVGGVKIKCSPTQRLAFVIENAQFCVGTAFEHSSDGIGMDGRGEREPNLPIDVKQGLSLVAQGERCEAFGYRRWFVAGLI